MTYKILIDKPAQKFLLKQSKQQQERLLRAIKRLSDEGDIKQLVGRSGFFRLRVGTFRVIFTVENDKLIVRVITIGNRGDVYK